MMIDANDLDLLHRAQEKIRTANAIVQFLSDYFRDKYGLTPDNQITVQGEIVSVSALQTKEKLNGTPINPSDGTDSNGTPPELSAMLDLSGNVAVLHGTTEDN